jgi:uncharacterized ferritin-like protein (DUF455 family)
MNSCPDWNPFVVVPRGERSPAPRSLNSWEGKLDRLRAAAFAELQAREAFLWAANTLTEAPLPLRTAWRGLAHAEDRHLQWLLRRLQELGGKPQDRPVSDQLWVSLTENAPSAEAFAYAMATAEDRGRIAGLRFFDGLRESDPETALIFQKIALEEEEHIALAERYFPDSLLRPEVPRSP